MHLLSFTIIYDQSIVFIKRNIKIESQNIRSESCIMTSILGGPEVVEGVRFGLPPTMIFFKRGKGVPKMPKRK